MSCCCTFPQNHSSILIISLGRDEPIFSTQYSALSLVPWTHPGNSFIRNHDVLSENLQTPSELLQFVPIFLIHRWFPASLLNQRNRLYQNIRYIPTPLAQCKPNGRFVTVVGNHLHFVSLAKQALEMVSHSLGLLIQVHMLF